MADAAVVGRDLSSGEQHRPPRAWSASRKPSSAPAGCAELVLPDRERRDPDAAADEHRAAPVDAGAAKADARAGRADSSSSPARARTGGAVPGPTSSSRNSSSGAPRRSAHAREGARQERPLRPPPHPTARGREHVELAGLRAAARRVLAAQHDVRPELLAARDRRPRGGRTAPARGRRSPGAGCLRVDLLQRDHLGSPCAAAAAIARAAAIPPDIVVMHGIRRATAAVRIS